MTTTTFYDRTTPIIASWLNDVDAATYRGTGTYLPSFAGATSSTVKTKLQEFVSVKDFGAIGDGVTDDTAAILQAITASYGTITGHKIYFPAGIYKITSTIDIGDKQNMFLVGDGSNCTVVRPYGSISAAFTFGNTGTAYQGISDMHIDCSNATAASAITVKNVNSFWSNGITVTYADIGFNIIGGVVQYYTNFQINLSKTAGIKLNGGNDQFFKHGLLSSVGSPQPSVAGIWCIKSDAFWIDSVDAISQNIGLYLAPTGTDYISWVFASNCAFDTCTGDGISISPGPTALVKGVTFMGCWSSTNNFGVNITNTGTVDTVRFVGHRSFNNKKSGYNLGNLNARNIFFNDSDAAGNSQETSLVWSGFDISAGCSNFSITSCRSGTGAGFGVSQARGILINTGASDNFVVANNDLRGNTTGFLDLSTGTNRVVSGNLGAVTAKRGTATITSGTASIVVTHGLDFTPAISDIICVPVSNMASAGLTNIWVSTVTSTTFTISANTNATANISFAWDARLKGA